MKLEDLRAGIDEMLKLNPDGQIPFISVNTMGTEIVFEMSNHKFYKWDPYNKQLTVM